MHNFTAKVGFYEVRTQIHPRRGRADPEFQESTPLKCRRMRVSGRILWILCSQFFVCEQVARIGWNIPYSFRHNYISDLGATVCGPLVCSPWHALMNASFALQGLLIASGALVIWKHLRGAGRAGLGLLVASGVGVLVVGFVPENGDVQVHGAFAALHFLGGGLGILFLGLWMRGVAGWASAAVGLVIIAATVLLGQRTAPLLLHLGTGLVERVAAYGIAGWMVAAGIYLWTPSRVPLRTTSRTSG
jgi:hypothetical membrane protein